MLSLVKKECFGKLLMLWKEVIFLWLLKKNYVFKIFNNIIYFYDYVLVFIILNISIFVCYFIMWKFYFYYRYFVLILYCWEGCNFYDN